MRDRLHEFNQAVSVRICFVASPTFNLVNYFLYSSFPISISTKQPFCLRGFLKINLSIIIDFLEHSLKEFMYDKILSHKS